MIYLKTFENNQDCYHIITDRTFGLTNKISIRQKIKNLIINRGLKGQSSIIIKLVKTKMGQSDGINKIEIDQTIRISGDMAPGEEHLSLDRFANIDIYESMDEWFLVSSKISYRPKSYWNTPNDTTLYYMCDQLDGLVKLLEDISIIEPLKK